MWVFCLSASCFSLKWRTTTCEENCSKISRIHIALSPSTFVALLRSCSFDIYFLLLFELALLDSERGELWFQLSSLQDAGPADHGLRAGRGCADFGPFGQRPRKSNTLKLQLALEIRKRNLETESRSFIHSFKRRSTWFMWGSLPKLFDMHVDISYFLQLPQSFPQLLLDWVTQSYIMFYCLSRYNQHVLVRICGQIFKSEPRSISFSTLRRAHHILIRQNCECGRNEKCCCLQKS